MKKTAIIVSGYFNPIHKGHIEYLSMARHHADELIVIVNNDKQRELKGSKKFMNQDERLLIVSSLKLVDKCYLSIDNDKSVCNTINKIHDELKSNFNLSFGNGGDQTNNDIPEAKICNDLGIKLIDNLGEKIQSSSWLLK